MEPVDRHVGLRIKMRRREAGMTQEQLAEAIGVTVQQVQKYERGVSRVSASRLWGIGRALRAPPGYFFDGLVSEHAAPCAETAEEFLRSPEAFELATRMVRVRPSRLRRLVFELIDALAEHGPTNEAEARRVA